MHIILLIDNLGSGGGQKQLYLLAKGLHSKKINITVITYHQYTSDFYSGLLKQMNIQVITLDYPNYIKRLIKVAEIIRKIKPTHVISYLYGANILACIIHLVFFRTFKLFVSDRTGVIKKQTLRDRFRYNLYRTASIVIANNSDTSSKIIQRAPWLKFKTKVIWNMVEEQDTYGASLKKSLNKRFKIVIGASYQKLKNPDNFIKAIRLFLDENKIDGSKLEVNWFGNMLLPKNELYVNSLKALIEEYSLKDVFFLYDQTKFLMREILDADFCALPSFYEGCPNFVIESMFASKPILISDVCSNRDIIDEKDGGFFFNPGSSSSISTAILKAYNTSIEERVEMGKYNRNKALNMFSFDSNLTQYLTLINA